MLNNVNVMGRLTSNPVMRFTQNRTPVCSFSIACERDYAADGEEKEVDFIDCVAWRKTAEFVKDHFSKGSTAIVSGRLQKRSYVDSNDKRRYVTEIVAENVYFGDSKRSGSPGSPNDREVLTPSAFEELEGDVETEDLPF